MFNSKITQKQEKQQETMEETISLIFHGCRLVKDLESSLPNLANQPDTLSKLCDDIIKVFVNAKERLNAHQDYPASTLFPHMVFPDRERLQTQQPQSNIDPSLQEWLRTSCSSAMELLHQTQLMGERSSSGLLESKGGLQVMELCGRDFQAMQESDSARASSSSQRPRRRKDDGEKRIETVPAPSFGNTEIPPDDGFTWRKYGQKEILGSKFPRAYYRCTHQKLYQCPAKKQVQRLDNDPFTFEVTYRGEHTCHMSATAPSVPPPPPPPPQEITQDQMTQSFAHQPPPAGLLTGWLEFSLGGGGSGSSSSVVAPPSTNIRYGKETADFPITDMADAMFNSGSSSTNSMEFIFPPVEDKWEPEPGPSDHNKN